MLGEKKMNVTLYAYNLFEKRIREKGKKDVEYFEKDFVECVKALMIRKPNDRKYELGNKKKIILMILSICKINICYFCFLNQQSMVKSEKL